MFKKQFYFLTLILLSSIGLMAQDKEEKIMPFNAGISASGNLNMMTHDMTVDTYSINENALGFGTSAGVIFNIPATRNLFVSAYAGYHGFFGNSDVAGNDPNVSSMKSMMHYIEISPSVRYYGLWKKYDRFYLTGGLEASIPLATEYDFQVEDVEAAEIPNAMVRPAVTLGAGYSFKVSERSYITPEVTIRFPFTEVSDNKEFQSWTIPQVRVGAAWTFSLEKPVPPVEPDAPAPELKTGFKSVNFYKNDGSDHPLEKIKVEEIQYKELFPMVPYIFCNENTVSPGTNQQSLAAKNPAGDFQVTSLKANAMEINKSILDIIGTRMKEITNARLTIKGTKDIKTEGKESDVDQKRADWAKTYLVSNYGISENRINAKGVGAPEKPSSPRVEDGQAENRRIEIYSDNPGILAPIEIEKAKTRLAEPAYVEFVPFAHSNEEVEKWEFEILQGGKILRKHSGSGTPDSILWNIFPNELAASEIPVDYRFSAKSESGLESYADGSIPVEYFAYNRRATQQKADSTISKFSLIVFDFDSPEISEVDKQILLKNVIPAISHKSTVKIYGYSDRIGEEKYNQRLALNRAENVRKILQAKARNARYEVYGVGENIEVFDNNSPIGRQLSRTVQIYVITAD